MVVEDNPRYREVITLALKEEAEFELASQFGTSEIALRSLQQQRPSANGQRTRTCMRAFHTQPPVSVSAC